MSHHLLSTILRHDAKQTSYKIALLRALNDVVLTHPDLDHDERDVAVPLRALAAHWVAYYWPFVDPHAPVLQGVPTVRNGRERQDIAFRADLTELRRAWEALHGSSSPADGFLLIDQLRVPRKRRSYPREFVQRYEATLKTIVTALRQPIRYAGVGQHTVFPEPRRLRALEGVRALPGAAANDACLRLPAALWRAFHELSLWVEALCVHEWSLLTERLDGGVPRGDAYRLLTEHPASRLPLGWERNRIDLQIEEGVRFTCPWTGRSLAAAGYDLDHIVPVAVYPFHELWNLVPADPDFNRNRKRDRLPADPALARAAPILTATYRNYRAAGELGVAFREDVALRFAAPDEPAEVVAALRRLVGGIARARNLETF